MSRTSTGLGGCRCTPRVVSRGFPGRCSSGGARGLAAGALLSELGSVPFVADLWIYGSAGRRRLGRLRPSRERTEYVSESSLGLRPVDFARLVSGSSLGLRPVDFARLLGHPCGAAAHAGVPLFGSYHLGRTQAAYSVRVREMHIDPEKSRDRATAAMTQQAAQLQALETGGIPPRPKDIEGGLDGVKYGYDALFPEFRRQWKSVDDKPIMREPRLPDDETDMDMGAFYKTCIDSGLKDMEIVSKIRLYGASTNSTADTGVDVLQNYKIDADGLDHIQTDRDAKLQLTTITGILH